jgi:hypothetical protein
MQFGSTEIDRLAYRARAEGGAEAMWPLLRAEYFREGTPDQAWDCMVAGFAARGCKVFKQDRAHRDGAPFTWVILRPA